MAWGRVLRSGARQGGARKGWGLAGWTTIHRHRVTDLVGFLEVSGSIGEPGSPAHVEVVASCFATARPVSLPSKPYSRFRV
jgi:hypothetical protein